MPGIFPAHKTERTAVAILMHWMREIIEKNNLGLGLPDVDTISADRKSPDMVIYESRRSKRVLCVIEAKPPYYDVFSEQDLKKPAWEKANQRKAKYFAVTNFRELIWFNTEKVNALEAEEQQIVDKFYLSELENLDRIEEPIYSKPIKRALTEFLLKLFQVHTGKISEPKLAIDELLIFRLYTKIKSLSRYYRQIIYDRCHKDKSFANDIQKWFADQGWNFTWSKENFDQTARQTAYLLINKILFYHLLQAKRPDELDPLEIPEGLRKGSMLQKTLQGYFSEVLKIDYETIYTTDFIDNVAFPESKEVVAEIKELVNILKKYDFSKLGYDVIGRIFERLIPPQERHILGQYFTNPDVVDLILRFCLHHEDDKILDPACGAGTFLVRAYQHKKIMNQLKPHEDILETLWGIDIAKFPAHLAVINLAINDLSVDHNYPNIIQKDFFEFKVGEKGLDLESWRKARASTIGFKDREVTYPRWFDAIVGNPPYTRQEEIKEISPDDAEYKNKLIQNALLNPKGEKLADISKRAGIYTYFFIHGTKMIKDKGYFGFIVASSWLDVDYGKGLQEFFLKNYKIIAIIESKIERWFEEADVNTCIIILEKCKKQKKRENNLVRFVYLKKPLSYFIKPAQDIWEKEIERLHSLDALIRTILAHNQLYENEELRIYPVLQKNLWKEGFDENEQKYLGSKWGKYLRAPSIFFKIIEKGKNKLIPFKEIAEVRFGIKTGINEFFYLDEEKIKKWKIEDKYLEPVIFSLKEIEGYVLEKKRLKYKVLLCHEKKEKLKGKRVLKYIEYGESHKFHERPTCSSRNPWYSLAKGWKYAPLLFPSKVGERMPVIINQKVFEDKKLYGIIPGKKRDKKLLAALLNSALTRFFVEFSCRQLTGAQAIADIDVIVVKNIPVINPDKIPEKLKNQLKKAFDKLSKTKAESIFKELGGINPDELSLDKVKKERLELDSIIMRNILGLTKNEQLEVYQAVVDLVRSRLEKAKSISKTSSSSKEIGVDRFVNNIIEEINSK